MLGKMLKYDIKDYSKSILPICLMLFIISIVTRIFSLLENNIESLKTMFSILFGISTFIFCIVIIISFVYCFFISIRNYYKKVLKEEGYLTHTLPIKKGSIISSQIISSLIWILITGIVVIVTLAIAYYEKGMLNALWQVLNTELNGEIIVSPLVTLIIIVAMMLCSYISTILAIYCSMTIGHGFSNNKIGNSIIAGIIFYVAYQILSVIGLGTVVLLNYDNLETITNNTTIMMNVVVQIIAIAFIINIIIGIVSYALTNYNLKRRLNLE